MILVHINGVKGDCTIEGYRPGQGVKGNSLAKEEEPFVDTGWFVAESFSFGVEREMKESGREGGTADINIGVGQLNECTVEKSMDSASPLLAQFAINGNSLGTAFIDFVEVGGATGSQGKPLCYLRYKLHRCFIKSWESSGSADDRPTENVAFYYNKIAFQYLTTKDGKTYDSAGDMKWDNVKNEPWADHGINIQPLTK